MNFKRIFAVLAVIGITGVFTECNADNNRISFPNPPNETNNTNNYPQGERIKYGIPQKTPNPAIGKYGIPFFNEKTPKYTDNYGVKKYEIPELTDNKGTDEQKSVSDRVRYGIPGSIK